MIETITWKLGGAASYINSSIGFAKHFYEYERGTSVYSGRPVTWNGNVALIYPSDYGYATCGGVTTNRETCLATTLYLWDRWESTSDCYNNNWLHDNNTTQWSLTPHSSINNNAFRINTAGNVSGNIVDNQNNVRPSVYLKSFVSISGGDGSSSSPYTLKM